MAEHAREPAAGSSGRESPGVSVRFAAAGGPGSTSLDHASAGSFDGWRHDDRGLRDPFLRGAVDAMALLAGLLLTFCGAVLAARRLAGAMTTPPGPAAIIAASTAAVALLLVADRGSRRGPARLAGRLARFGLLATVAAMALPLRIAAPAATITAVAALVVAGLIVGLGAMPSAARVLGRGIPFGRPGPPPRPVTAETMQPTARLPEAWDAGMQQRFERRALTDGGERVHGRVLVTVAAGSRLGVAHVGFCPPLPTTPVVEATTEYDGVEAVVSAAEVLPWGVRVECRLDEPAEELIEIPVDMVATARA